MKDFVLFLVYFWIFCNMLVSYGGLLKIWSCCGAWEVIPNYNNLAASLCCRALTTHGGYGWNNNWQPLVQIVQGHLFHHSNQLQYLQKHWKWLKGMLKFLKSLMLFTRWWEVSDSFQTYSIDRLFPQPYHNTVKENWLFFFWMLR